MFLLVDIGNTSIKFGFAQSAFDMETYTLPSNPLIHSVDSLGLQVLGMLEHQNILADVIEKICVSSVVPALDKIFREVCKRFLGQEVFFVQQDISVPMENRYHNPDEVGADRLIAAYAARNLFPDAKSIISVDFGTATTFDCVTDNAYLGGLICPGVLSSHEALSQKAAKLPRIALEVDAKVPCVGQNTAMSMAHGFVFGFAMMTEGLLCQLKEQLPSPLSVVATGGFAPDIAKHVPHIERVESHLILCGLYAIIQR